MRLVLCGSRRSEAGFPHMRQAFVLDFYCIRRKATRPLERISKADFLDMGKSECCSTVLQ